MAGGCAAFDNLALRAVAAQQQRVPAALQPMQQSYGVSRLDAALYAARQDTPFELQRWWEEQLDSNRVRSLKDEIEKWTNHISMFPPSKAGPGRERLRRLRAVEDAVRRGLISAEVLTLHGWRAHKREQDLRQQQAQAEAQLAAAQLSQHTPLQQNGGAVPWLDRAKDNQQQFVGDSSAPFTQPPIPWFQGSHGSRSSQAAAHHTVPKDRRGQALAAAAAVSATNSSAMRNCNGLPAGRLGSLSMLPRPTGSQRITHTPAASSAAHANPAEASRRLRSSGLPCDTCSQYFDRRNLRRSQLADDKPDDWMCHRCWQQLLPQQKWPSLEADKNIFDTANAIGRAGAAAAPSKGARRRKKAAGSAEPADHSQQTILGSMGKGKLPLRRTGAGSAHRDGGSGSSEDEWEQVGNRGRRGATARRRASQRTAAAQQMPGGNAEEPVTLLSSDEDDPAQPVGRQDTTGAGGSPELDQEWPDSGSKRAPVPQPRRSERANIHRSTGDRFKGCVAVYPAGRPDGVEVRGSDLARLDDDEFLNDTVIDLYIRYIQEHLPDHVRSRCHFFNSFFFKKLTEKGPRKSGDGGGSGGAPDSAYKRGFERVRKWTRGVDIFAKDWLFVPIHDHLHWSLVLVAHPGVLPGSEPDREQCIIHFDSMEGGGHSTPIVTRAMRQYLQNEWERLAVEGPDECVPKQWAALNPGKAHPNYTTLKNCPGLAAPKLPKQDNHCDCGLFLLAFLEYFVYSPPTALTAEAVREGHIAGTHEYRGFMSKVWFTDRNAGALRGFLRSIILEAFVEQGKAKAEFLRAEGKDHEARLAAEGVAAAEADLREYQLRIDNGGRGYVSPAAYQPDAKLAYNKMLEAQARAAELRERRKQEAAERRAEEAASKKRVREESRARILARSRDAPDAISLGDDRDEGARAHDSDADLLNADMPIEQRRHRSRSSGRPSASDDGEDIELVLSESPEDAGKAGSDAVVIPATDDEEAGPAQPRVRKRRGMRRSLIADSDADSRDAIPAQQQERSKRTKRNGPAPGANFEPGGRGCDGAAGEPSAFDTLLADETAPAAPPDGQQAAALDLATGLQSDDDQATQPLPQGSAGAAAHLKLAGAPKDAGGKEQSPAEVAAAGTQFSRERLTFELLPPALLRDSSAEGTPSSEQALDAAQAAPVGQQQQHSEAAGDDAAAPLPLPHIADFSSGDQPAAAGTDRRQQHQDDQEVLLDMHPLFRARNTPAQDGRSRQAGSSGAAPAAAGPTSAALRQQQLPNAFAAYAMEDGSFATVPSGPTPGTSRRRRSSAPIDKRRRILAAPDDASTPPQQSKPGFLAGFGAIAKLASLWPAAVSGHSHPPASSDGAALQHAPAQQDLHVDAASAGPSAWAAGPAGAGHGGSDGHRSQPLASPLSDLLFQPVPTSSGSVRGAKRRKAKRPAQKSGGEAAPQQRQQWQQQPAGLMAPSAEEAAELQLSEGDDGAADGGRHSRQLGNGSANGLTGPWEPFPTNSGGRRTAARATEAAAVEPIALDLSSGTASG